MGQNQGKEIGLPARMKTRPASPQEWRAVRGDARPLEWRKNPGEIAREWE